MLLISKHYFSIKSLYLLSPILIYFCYTAIVSRFKIAERPIFFPAHPPKRKKRDSSRKPTVEKRNDKDKDNDKDKAKDNSKNEDNEKDKGKDN